MKSFLHVLGMLPRQKHHPWRHHDHCNHHDPCHPMVAMMRSKDVWTTDIFGSSVETMSNLTDADSVSFFPNCLDGVKQFTRNFIGLNCPVTPHLFNWPQWQANKRTGIFRPVSCTCRCQALSLDDAVSSTAKSIAKMPSPIFLGQIPMLTLKNKQTTSRLA